MDPMPCRPGHLTGLALALSLLIFAGCAVPRSEPGPAAGATLSSQRAPATFGEDLAFLKKHTDVILLSTPDHKGKVAVVPQYQGRVMTSTARGSDGPSYGWINRDRIRSNKLLPHMNPYGGEDRFWMGPEGGQFAIFFPPEVPFDLEHWQTPPVIDSEPFELVAATDSRAVFHKVATFANRAGFIFTVRIDRTLTLLNRDHAERMLDVKLPESVDLVAYESKNRITNVGADAWRPESGLLSIWILGMFQPGPNTTVVIPIEPGSEAERGTKVNDTYFGKVPADRLIARDDVLFFRGDGAYRSKIGVPPLRAKSMVGSYDAYQGMLTIVSYTLPPNAQGYVNSMWEVQDKPYGGDVVNSYNDGPPAPGAKPLGPFYEIESSSPAAALAPNTSLTHLHRTFHLQGPAADLDAIAQKTLGVTLAEIEQAF